MQEHCICHCTVISVLIEAVCHICIHTHKLATLTVVIQVSVGRGLIQNE